MLRFNDICEPMLVTEHPNRAGLVAQLRQAIPRHLATGSILLAPRAR